MTEDKTLSQENNSKSSIFIVIGIILAVCLLSIILLNYGYKKYDHYLQTNVEEKLQLKTDSYGKHLQIVINERFRLLESLQAFCQREVSNPDFEQRFQIYSAGLTAGIKGIKYIALAPKGEITLIYPMLGHEELFGETIQPIGFDPDNRKVAKSNIIIETLKVTDDEETLLNAYIPIYIKGEYWGFASIQMSIYRLFFEAGLDENIADMEYIVRTSDGFVIRGNSEIFDKSPISYAIPIPDGYWELAAIPQKGWHNAKANALLSYQIISFLLFLLICVITAVFSLHYVSLKKSVDEKTFHINKYEESLQKLQKEIKQTKQIDEIDTLVTGIAHDFDNQLADISSQAKILKKKLKDDERLSKKVEKILELVKDSKELTNKLMAHANKK